MIATIWKVGWLNLLRDRPALALTFAMPLLFFSIFAAVFGAMDRGGVGVIQTALVIEGEAAAGALERAIEGALRADERIDLATGAGRPRARSEALRQIRSGRLTAAVVVPGELAAALSGAAGEPPRVEVLVDRRSNPIAAGVLEASMKAVIFRLWLEARFPPGTAGVELPVELVVDDVVEKDGSRNPSVAFFAAGIGVMFLLFAVSGRGSLLIDERQSGVLTRMLTAGIGLTPILTGRWLYLASLGFLQVTVMFVWGSIAFDLELWTARRLAGFALMTAVTAAAAAALGLLLSVVCRTRAQLNGVAVVLVLAMSALGGSLFPRFLMPEGLRRLGLATFNAWALDGYRKVFWYDSAPGELWPQLVVLAAVAAVLLFAARLLANRWVDGVGL